MLRSAQSGIRSCRFVLDSNHSQACFIKQTHTSTHTVFQFTVQSRHHGARRRKGTSHHSYSTSKKSSTVHNSTGSQQTSQGTIRHSGSLSGIGDCEITRGKYGIVGTAERFV